LSWATLEPELRELIMDTLTEKEIDVLVYRMANLGWRPIGRALGISPRAARDRYDNALRKLAAREEEITEWLPSI
jgi:FixJ family two-component response regulator